MKVIKKKLKRLLLRSIIDSNELDVQAVYGAPKDVAAYSTLGLNPGKIFIIGRQNRKLSSKCTVSQALLKDPYHETFFDVLNLRKLLWVVSDHSALI